MDNQISSFRIMQRVSQSYQRLRDAGPILIRDSVQWLKSQPVGNLVASSLIVGGMLAAVGLNSKIGHIAFVTGVVFFGLKPVWGPLTDPHYL